MLLISTSADRVPVSPDSAGRCSFETSSKPVPNRVLSMPLFHITLREHTYTGRFYNDVVEAGSFEEALQLAAGQAARPEPPPGFRPQPNGVKRRRCADVWIYSLLHCELAEGHDPPHMAVARGYWRPVRWVRDDRGLACNTESPGLRVSLVVHPRKPPG